MRELSEPLQDYHYCYLLARLAFAPPNTTLETFNLSHMKSECISCPPRPTKILSLSSGMKNVVYTITDKYVKMFFV
jgi:hypothetical protein